MTRPCDIIRRELITNALPDHHGAVTRDESLHPFIKGDCRVIYCNQSGLSQVGFLSSTDVEVFVFSKTSGGRAEQDACFSNARTALNHLRDVGYNIRDKNGAALLIVPSIVQDVTGPTRTRGNRFYYVFTVNCMHQK